MIFRNSQRVPPCSARESRASASSIGGARDKLHHSSARERLIDAERGNPFRDDAPDQPGTLVFIEFGRSGIAVPCLHFSFIHEREVANAR